VGYDFDLFDIEQELLKEKKKDGEDFDDLEVGLHMLK